MKKLFVLFFLFVGVSVSIFSEPHIIAVTENYPPYNYMVDGKVVGFSADIVREILQRANISAVFKLYPWMRSYTLTQKLPNYIIFSIVRTKEREKKFKWLGKLTTIKVYFYALKDKKITINKISDLNGHHVGVALGDVIEEELRKNGIKDKYLMTSADDKNNLKLLFYGRIDTVAYDDATIRILCKKYHYDYGKLKKIYYWKTLNTDLYFATGLKTDENIVKKIKESYDKFIKSKKYRAIYKKYFLK